VQQSTGIGANPAARGRGSDFLTVEIEVNGEVFTSNYRIEASPDSVRREAEIAVRFDPDNPNRIVRDRPPRPMIGAFMIPAILAGLIFAAIITNLRIIAPRKGKREQDA